MNKNILLATLVCSLPFTQAQATTMLAPPSLQSVIEHNEARLQHQQAEVLPVLAPPSLQSVMEQNEVQLQVQLEERARQQALQNTGASSGTGIQKPVFPFFFTYTPVAQGNAITLFRANEAELWKQEIDLSKGVGFHSILVNEWYDDEEAGGEPLFAKMTMTEMQNTLSVMPFSMINGQFFDPRATPTRLSFGLKVDGVIRTVGADNGRARKNILIIDDTGAQIIPYTSWLDINNARGNMVMVNLSANAPHYPNSYIGRTTLCLANPDEENRSSRLIIFTAVAMDEVTLEREALRHGCRVSSITKFDSSGSTRLWTPGGVIYGNGHKGNPDYRRIPHAIAIYDAR